MKDEIIKEILSIVKTLLKPRTIITLCFVFTLCILSFKQVIDTAVIVGAVNAMLGYWFGEKMAKIQNGGSNVGKDIH